ncbi:MAG: C39 family peptidase [Saprospiraceae bacterium]
MILLNAHTYSGAQIMSIPEVIQEQTNWCWAACTKCILGYYNYSFSQCEIAEYTRSVSTSCNPNNYGSVNCCTNPNQGCNQWNYNWGCPGSMQDILIHFGNITTYSLGSTITTAQIHVETASNHPFLFRWGWYSGGGHFLVGYGISGSNIYYMNPLPGYGDEISNYNWVVDDGIHSWTHTQTIKCDGISNIWKGGTNTNWTTGSNWSCGVVPTSTTTVYIYPSPPNNPMVNANATVASLMVHSPSNLTLKTGFTLTVHP